MRQFDPNKQRDFAVEVVRQLRDHGFQAYWAGGCVRDQLLGLAPKDYDVATSAQPEEIRTVFGNRKTLSIGAAFGVMTVLGPRGAGQIEVVTFRKDVSYSDGRHPDRVEFSSPELDAQRRDFTVNGMFYDPLAEQVIDFVGGQADLDQHLLRAIGNAHERFTEDKLRMLRAVRFAAVFNFRVEPATLAAMREMAAQVTVVAAERIAEEMQITLVQPRRVRAVCLLHSTGLLRAILPEADTVASGDNWNFDDEQATAAAGNRKHASCTLSMLAVLERPSFPLALAVLVQDAPGDDLAEVIGRRWKLSRSEIERFAWLRKHQRTLADASSMRWSQLQPLLIDEGAEELLQLHAAAATVGLIDQQQVDYCREQLRRSPAELNPPPLITGSDLLGLGIPAGPVYARLLRAARDAQLDGVIADRDSALRFVQELCSEGTT